jgi:hypothetical protein
MEDARHYLSISHASEDKESVARPLCDALTARGWTVWLDELELTIGDSLSGRIDAALARSRFGVVVLSEAFFSKEWPKRELAGLAAREVAAGSKVILPIWHGIDESYLIRQSPTLADRLGADTRRGIADVAAKVASALERADRRADPSVRKTVVQPVEDDPFAGLRFDRGVPTTDAERRCLIESKPPCWETILFAGYLWLGRERLESKWHEHELGIPYGTRRDFDSVAATSEYVRREPFGILCEVRVPVRGLLERSDRIVAVTTSWELRDADDRPRLVTAYIDG